MSWAVTADPDRFNEAADWFLKRVVITKRDAATLDVEALQRAFWIGGGLQLSQVQGVFDEIAVALEKGEPFEDFRKRVRDVLRNDAHAETVFRNAVQRSYNAGRFEQMTEPSIAQLRPYWMFDAVLDSRTTTVCKERDATVLPIDHPFWQSNIPPLHHRCRSGIRSLRKAEAERRGISPNPPDVEPTPGWGLAPGKAPIWKPDPAKHDKKLLDELERKQSKPKRERKQKPKPEHDPAHWVSTYSHLADAASSAAWGRAMYQRGLDRTVGQFRTELRRLKDAGHPALVNYDLRDIDALPARVKVKNTVLAASKQSGLVALTEHTRAINLRALVSTTGPDTPGVKAGRRFYDLTADRSVAIPKARVTLIHGRAYADKNGIFVQSDVSPGVATHELAHVIEFNDPRALRNSMAMLKARADAGGNKLRHLGPGYGPKERAWEDQFLKAYQGKDYGGVATEITSMGYQDMIERIELIGEFDPEMLYFLLGQLAGR